MMDGIQINCSVLFCLWWLLNWFFISLENNLEHNDNPDESGYEEIKSITNTSKVSWFTF